jgi:hypothetical protein
MNSLKAAEYRRVFKDVSSAWTILAAADPDRTIVAAPSNAKKQVFVQKIAVFVSTSAAQAITFQSSATSVIVGILGASAPIGEHVVFELEEGFALPAGEGLLAVGTAGVAAGFAVQAYERLLPGAVLTPDQL